MDGRKDGVYFGRIEGRQRMTQAGEEVAGWRRSHRIEKKLQAGERSYRLEKKSQDREEVAG
jgi:hypothetical protein